MSHYRLTDSMPSAIILARNPRTGSLDELKTYQENQIFLNNKDEFQIRLFNPLTEKIGVSIELNGKLPNGLLILNPGQDVIVDRFIEDKKKMVFETYQYDAANPAAAKAVASNGVINLRFFKEYTPPQPYYNCFSANIGMSGSSSGTYSTLSNINGMGGLPHFTNSTTTIGGGNIGTGGSTLTSSSYFSSCVDNSLDFADDFNTEGEKLSEPKSRGGMKIKGKQMAKSLVKETGRVEKGQSSNQDFDLVNAQFETFPFYVVSYYLKPNSEKDSMVTEIREYCTSCGYRLRNRNWSYCPKCGEKQ